MLFGFFSKKKKIDETLLEQLEEEFIKSDIGMLASNNILVKLRKTKFDTEITYEELNTTVKNIIIEDLKDYFNKGDLLENIHNSESKPYVIMFCGINGVGKTTSIAKIAKLLTPNLKTLLVPGDTFRAGAKEQLKLWSEKLNTEFFDDPTQQPAALTYKALEYSKNNNIDITIIDTAGRIDNNDALMDELNKIEQTMKKVIPSAPHCNILVLDGTSGQIAVQQAKNFAKFVNVDGIILSKMDSNAKGGAIINIIKTLHCPIYYLGKGENEKDLQKFNLNNYVDNLIGN